MSVESILIESAAALVGKAIDTLLRSNPSAETKVEAGKRIAKQGLALIPRDELITFLTDGDAHVAEAVFLAAKIAKLASQR